MPRVATYVFFDTETTGLPAGEINKTRITELCLLAVKRDHLVSLPSAAPRVQHKLTLCLYPRKQVSEEAALLTGLSNELLEHEPVFDLEVYRLLNSFLAVLTAPVCLVAHNGLGFDYPILQNHLQKLAVGFADDLLCVDSFHGFYDILENRKLMATEEMPAAECKELIPQSDAYPTSSLSSYISSPASKKPKLSDEDAVDLASPSESVKDEFYTNNLNMKAINEATPKKNKYLRNIKPNPKLHRRMPWINVHGFKPTDSYKLEDIYTRVLDKKPLANAHRAENDCIFALEISAALSKEFAEWVDNNCVLFSEVKPMTPGVNVLSLRCDTGLLTLTGILWGCSNPFIRAGTQGLREVQAATWGGQAWAEASFLLGNWRYVLPWLVNQSGSLCYLWGVQRAPLSLAVPLANGLAFACTALVGALTGREEPLHRGSILGIALIVSGIALCCLDKTS